jgi:scyllo-inositol 2-dehydrogenase (NADP+)
MTSAPQPVRIAIAGLGRAGWDLHAAALADLPGAYLLAAACDPDPARRQEARERFGCRVCADLPALLAEADFELLVLATPSQGHAAEALAALAAGRHVVVEKPMAQSLEQADAMIAAAQASGQVLTVHQNYRYAADFLKVKEVIASGRLGRLLEIKISAHQFARRWDWQTSRQQGGGMLANLGAHLVDIALQLIDDPEPEVFCDLQTTPLYAGDAESHVKIILRPRLGPLVDLEMTTACAYPQEQWLVLGTQGTLSGSRERIRWKWFDPASLPPLSLETGPAPGRSYQSDTPVWQEDSLQVQVDWHGDVLRFYRDLHASLRQRAPLAITPASVRRAMALIERCRRSTPAAFPRSPGR